MSIVARTQSNIRRFLSEDGKYALVATAGRYDRDEGEFSTPPTLSVHEVQSDGTDKQPSAVTGAFSIHNFSEDFNSGYRNASRGFAARLTQVHAESPAILPSVPTFSAQTWQDACAFMDGGAAARGSGHTSEESSLAAVSQLSPFSR